MSKERLGTKLRHHRRALGLTLDEVAAKSGCSESMLSKIETGRVNPSLDLLHRLAKALQINVAALFAGETDDIVKRSGKRSRIQLIGPRDGKGVVLEQLATGGAEGLLQACLHILEPGGRHGSAISHVGEEVGYLLKGSIELQVDEEIWTLREGDSFNFRSERPHTYSNVGRVPAMMIVVNTPPTF